MTEKAEGAFRTIGELSAELGVPQHILRYWETRFSQLRPMTRAGNRRYYRAEDVNLVRRIHGLLYGEGYTVKGVQKLLSGKAATAEAPSADVLPPPHSARLQTADSEGQLAALKAIRNRLAAALSA